MAYRVFLILEEVDDVLGDTHIEASLDLIRISSLEYRSDHSKSTFLSSSIDRILLKSVETLSDRDKFVIVGRGAVHGDEEAQREMVHLFREDLAGLKGVGNTLDIVVKYWVATLTHS